MHPNPPMENERSRNTLEIQGDTQAFFRYDGAELLLKQLARDVSFEVLRATQMVRGQNNGVFALEESRGKKLVAKFYQRDDRARLDREYRANAFLSANAFCVARPILRNDDHNFGVYSFENGDAKRVDEITAYDIDALADFLVRLQRFTPSTITETFPRAVGAMVNMQEVIDDNTRRIASFRDAITQGTMHPLVVALLNDVPFLDDIARMTDTMIAQSKNTTWHILPEDQRLSPVDFGFHNALFRNDAPPVILDLEYFGWDDPLHVVADFVTHDQTLGLSKGLRDRFIQKYCDGVQLSKSEFDRLHELIQLTEIKWIAIYLTSLTPKYLAARSFAAPDSFDAERYIQEQVKKIEARKASIDA